MKVRWLWLIGILAAAGCATPGQPVVTKDVLLSGELACAKCVLKQPGVNTCSPILTVQEGSRTVFYTLVDNQPLKDLRETWKAKAVKVTVKGISVEQGEQRTVTANTIVVQPAAGRG